MIQTLARYRIARFGLAGILNSAVGFLVYSVTIVLGAPVWAALLSANLFGVVFNFFTIGDYAFRSRVIARFPRFVIVYAGIYALNWLCIDRLAGLNVNPIASQAILTPPLAMISYLALSKFVFIPTK